MPTHFEQRVVPYSADQMFDLVADVERYPQFLPWCVGSRITGQTDDQIEAEVAVGFKMFRERFRSRVTLLRDEHRINVEYLGGPMKYLSNSWRFEVLDDDRCCIHFFIEFEFRSKLMQRVAKALFHELVYHMVAAFERRARKLYGPVSQSARARATGETVERNDDTLTESAGPQQVSA